MPTPFRRAIDAIVPWFVSDACRTMDIEDVMARMGELLHAHGFSVSRMATSLFTAHPEIHARELVWTRGGGTVARVMPYGVLETPTFQQSPIAAVLAGEERIRCRLWIEEERARFPLLAELHRAGATDYVINAVRFRDGRINCLSIASDRPGGLTDDEIDALRVLLPLAAMRLELDSMHYALGSLLSVYLGPNAAAHVARGAFRRGTGARIDAAIWFSDLRGFTALGDARPPEEVVAVLDAHFDIVGRSVTRHGGEILKFIGDAVLAIFPCGEDPAAACRRAVAAAREALDETAVCRAEGGLPLLGMGVAVHVGEVMYGNVGAQERLDFTVIGAAVNTASRVEAMCKPLGASLLFTGEVARHLRDTDVVSLGTHALRGIGAPVALYGVAQTTPAGG